MKNEYEDIEVLELDLPKLKEEDINNIIDKDVEETINPKKKEIKKEEKKEIKEETIEYNDTEYKPIPLKIKGIENNINIDEKSSGRIQNTLLIIISIILLITSIILISDIIKNIEDEPVSNIVEIDTNKEMFITGSYKTTNDSLFTFNEDGTFYWFDNYNDLDNNYYSGTYTYLRGLEAVNEMGYKEEEITQIFGADINIDNVYSIKINPTSAFKNNRNVTKKELKENTIWWYILVLKDDTNAIGYNKTIDARYTLTRK